MRLRSSRVAGVVVGTAGLLATAVPPASATTAKVLYIQGDMQISSGMGYPGMGHGEPDIDKVPCTISGSFDPACVTVKHGPKGQPLLNLSPQGNHAGFFLGSSVCLKVSTSSDLTKKFPGPALCSFSMAGAAWGFCDLFTAIGVAKIDNHGLPPITGSLKESTSVDAKLTGIAGYVYLTGGTQTTNISSLFHYQDAIQVGGPNCFNKTQTTWTTTGTAVYKDIT